MQAHRQQLNARAQHVLVGLAAGGLVATVLLTWLAPGPAVIPAACLVATALVIAFARLQVLARRDAERANARLREAREEALHHARARDGFLSMASHELKTPLTALQLHVDGLLRAFETTTRGRLTFEPDRVRRRLESVARQSRQLGRLIDALLDASRAADGRLPLHLETFDLADLVQEIAARFEPELARASCELRVRCERGLIGQWDRVRVDQVLSNLLSNACKYGPGAPIELDATIDAREGAHGAVLVVRDRGIGIDPKDHARIFERFERACSDRKFGGFGVGLWIAREIVASMGGEIRVDSAPGNGATFTVRLPMRDGRGETRAAG